MTPPTTEVPPDHRSDGPVIAWWAGAVILAAGLGWLVIDHLLATYLPLTWGGPNIGGAMLWLAAQLIAAVGLLILLVAGLTILTQRTRPRPRLSRRQVLVPIGVNTALALTLIAVKAVLPGDVGPDGGLAGINGQVGVTVDSAGAPVLVLQMCRGSVDTITVVGPNINGRNEPIAVLRSSTAITSPTEVPLLSPPAGWSGAPASLPMDRLEFVIASASGSQSELSQVDFSANDLQELRAAGPQVVQYSTYGYDLQTNTALVNERTTRTDFADITCAGFSSAADSSQ